MKAPTPDEQLSKLKVFRQTAYEGLGPARDAQFELTAAVMLTRAINRRARRNSLMALSVSKRSASKGGPSAHVCPICIHPRPILE